MLRTEKGEIKVNFLHEKKPNHLWAKVWDLILHPVREEKKTSQLSFDLDVETIPKSWSTNMKKRGVRVKPRKPSCNQLSFWDLDKSK